MESNQLAAAPRLSREGRSPMDQAKKHQSTDVGVENSNPSYRETVR